MIGIIEAYADYKKHAPKFLDQWLDAARVPLESADRVRAEGFDSIASLAAAISMGSTIRGVPIGMASFGLNEARNMEVRRHSASVVLSMRLAGATCDQTFHMAEQRCQGDGRLLTITDR